MNVKQSLINPGNIIESQYEVLFSSIERLALKICESHYSSIILLNESKVILNSATGHMVQADVIDKKVLSSWIQSHEDIIEIKNIFRSEKKHPFQVDQTLFNFYSGMPIKLPLGEIIGILIVVNRKPSWLSGYQRIALRGLADIIEKVLLIENLHLTGRSIRPNFS